MLLSKLKYGSFLTYTPRPITNEQIKSKDWTLKLKKDNQVDDNPPIPTSRYFTNLLAQSIDTSPLRDLLGPDITLVPIPKSSLLVAGGLWVPERIAHALVDVGLGGDVAPIIKRVNPIRKSAFSLHDERPNAKIKYETLSIEQLLLRPQRIVVVDDVVTTGASLLGAASAVADSNPGIAIAGFAMIRTISDASKFEALINPIVGSIRLISNYRTRREP